MPDDARIARLLPLLLLVALVWAAPVGAAPPAVLDSEARVDAYPTVTIQLAIEDDRRRPVTGLTPESVTIVEGGETIRPSSVSLLRESATPLSVIVAVDTSLSMAEPGRLEGVREAVGGIVARLRPGDGAGLVRFGGGVETVQPLTGDRVALGQALDRLTAEGGRRLYDGAYLAVSEAARAPGNRAVLLVTSGEDLQGQAGLGQVKDLAADAGIKLYIVGLGEAVRDDLLESLAKGSGGRYYKAPRASDLPTMLRAAYDDFTGRYEIVYTAPAPASPTSERAVAQVTVATPAGTTTAAVAYRLPAAGVLAARQPPLQVVPPRPRPQPIDDRLILAFGALTALGLLASTLALLLNQGRTAREGRLRTYVSSVNRSYADADRPPTLFQLTVALLTRVMAAVFIRLLPPHQVRQISRRLLLAGSPFGWRVSHFVALKGALTLLGIFLGWLLPPSSLLAALLLPLLLGAAGFVLPEVWLNSRVRARQRQVMRALPSALDLLAISVEAGLSLDAAMLEVVHKWRNPLADEFAIILADLKVGKTRREAMRAFVHRTELPEVATFVSALIQADEIGLSIGRALAVQAEQMRLRQRQRAEKLAREASVKMLFPMAVLIFPAIFVVILVPALPTIAESLRSLGGG